MLLMAFMAPWAANGQVVPIGDGTSSDRYAPMNIYYNYSFAEMIYTADEIAAGEPTTNTILNVEFNHKNSQNKTYGITVYMKNVEIDEFSSTSYEVLSDDDIVFTGSVTPGSGWLNIELDRAFTYDNTKNLLIAINKTSGGYVTSNYEWYYTTTTGKYTSLTAQNDNDGAYDPTTSLTGTRRAYHPNVRLTFGTPATCPKPALSEVADEDIEANSATIRWTPSGEGQTLFDIYYSTTNVAPEESTTPSYSNVSGNSKEITGLLSATTYYVWLRGNCGTTADPDISGGWTASKSFNTKCGTIDAGYECGFEGPNIGGTTSYPLPACWTRPTGTSTSYPRAYEYSTYARTGSYSLYFYGDASSTKQIVVLPEINETINGKRLSFYVRCGYTIAPICIGYMTDPDNANTFVAVGDPITPTTSYPAQPYVIDFGSYEGDPRYIAIKSNSTVYASIYLDDIALSNTPSCFVPTNLAATLTPGNGTIATLNWVKGNNESAWVLQYATNNTFTEGLVEITDGFSIDGTNVSRDLTGLTAETTYYARVKADCTGGDYSEWSDVYEFVPTNAIDITVYNNGGSNTNEYAPIFGFYGDTQGTISQFIIPASKLTDVTDGTINKLTFYCTNESLTMGEFEIRLEEVEADEFASATLHTWGSDAVLVKTAYLNIANNQLSIVFTTPFEYHGGNLMIGTYIKTKASDTRIYWKGENQSKYTAICNKSSVTRYQFIPQTTISYIPNATPKPKNLEYSNVTSSSATLTWDEPNVTPLKYAYQFKAGEGEWTALTETTETSVTIEVEPSTTYTFQVKAIYEGGESDFASTSFPTLDACAIPTALTATTTPGQGTKATLNWTKGYDEEAWMLQYATDNEFTEGLVEVTDGFTTEGNNVTYNATGLTAETTYYARVKATCGPTSSSNWSNVVVFTPTNYVDYTYGESASTTNSNIPFYGYRANDTRTISQYIIPATELSGVVGGAIRSLTYYTTSSPNWGSATVKVYVKEVDYTTFGGASASYVEDWESMTLVYTGALSVNNGKMTISFAEPFEYGGNNLLIGIKINEVGSSSSVSWTSVNGGSNNNSGLYGYYNSSMYYYRTNYYPKTTINYLPTPYPRPVINEPIDPESTSATITWIKPSDNVTGYKYQYKLSSDDWTDNWESLGSDATSTTLSPLIPLSNYDFRIKAIYGENESALSTTDFLTPCPDDYPLPYYCGFEGPNTSGSNPIPMCWDKVTNGNYPMVSSSYAHTNSNSLCFYKSSTDANSNEIAIVPGLNAQLNTVQLLFWARMSSESNDNALNIGYYRDNTFTNVETINVTQSWYEYRVNFNSLDDLTEGRIAIQSIWNEGSTFIYVDDVKVKLIPTCETPSSDLAAVTDGTSVTLTWTQDGTPELGWEVVHSTNPDADPDDLLITNVGETECIIEDLTVDQTHYAWVRASCSNTDHSEWRGPVSFFIGYCTPGTTNRDGKGITAVHFGTGENIVNNSDATNGLPATSPYYGDYHNMVGAVEAGLTANVDITTNTHSSYDYPYTFIIWVDWDNNLQFEDDEIVYVNKCTNAVGTLNASFDVPSTQETGDYRMRIAGADSYFNDFYNNGDLNFDGAHDPCLTGNKYAVFHDYTLRVLPEPSCYPIAHLEYNTKKAHSVQLTWNIIDENQEAWDVQYSTDAIFPDGEATHLNEAVTLTDGAYRLSGLDASTEYFVRVRGNCDSDGTSTWSETINFTTEIGNPAPSNFETSEVLSFSAEFSWTNGGGDYETSWEIYLTSGTDTPEEPVEENKHVVNTNPVSIDELTASTQYFAWIRANCGTDGYSAWVALTDDSFETLEACPAPTVNEATNLSQNTADISWTGSSDDYTVQYASVTNKFFEGFEESTSLDSWSKLDKDGNTASSSQFYISSSAAYNSNYGVYINYTQNPPQYLISPDLSSYITGSNLVLEFYYRNYYYNVAYSETFQVGFSSTDNEITSFDFGETITASDQQWTRYSNSIPSGTKYIAIKHTSDDQYALYIDNFSIIEISDWTTAESGVQSPYTITGLTKDTKYNVKVIGNCGGTPSSDSKIISFTTLPENNIVFPEDGTWTAGDFVPTGAPTTEDDVIIRGDVEVTSGTNAYANNINIENDAVIIVESGATLTIAGNFDGDAENLFIKEGGQVIHVNAIEATAQKGITAYTSKDGDGWYFIASPVNNYSTSAITLGTYDLFAYDEATAYWWVDHAIPGQPANHTFNTLTRGIGYLYANDTDVTLNFSGSMIGTATEISKTLSYACSYDDVKGYNLMGNPFTRNIGSGDMTLDGEPVTSVLILNNDEEYQTCNFLESGTIKPGQGFFIQATAANQELTFNPSSKDESEIGLISIKAGNESYFDKAYIQIGGGNTLRKMTFYGDKSQVYVMNDGDDYAATTVYELAGAIPVNFKAAEDGEYSITVNTKNLEASTMLLYDDFTGATVNLLESPTYHFKASEIDNADRFKLVFDFNNYTGVNENYTNDNFAHQIGDELIVSGEGTLMVFDVLGRFVTGYNVNGDKRISTAEFNTGVYIFRMVGTEVKTQKIIVR